MRAPCCCHINISVFLDAQANTEIDLSGGGNWTKVHVSFYLRCLFYFYQSYLDFTSISPARTFSGLYLSTTAELLFYLDDLIMLPKTERFIFGDVNASEPLQIGTPSAIYANVGYLFSPFACSFFFDLLYGLHCHFV